MKIKMSDEPKKTEKLEVAPPVVVVPKVGLKSARDWAVETGNSPKKRSKNIWSKGTSKEPAPGMSPLKGSMMHECAAILHGWREHELHTDGAPLLMSQEDYLAALKATMPEVGNPVPHKPALSPHKGGGVKVTFKG